MAFSETTWSSLPHAISVQNCKKATPYKVQEYNEFHKNWDCYSNVDLWYAQFNSAELHILIIIFTQELKKKVIPIKIGVLLVCWECFTTQTMDEKAVISVLHCNLQYT